MVAHVLVGMTPSGSIIYGISGHGCKRVGLKKNNNFPFLGKFNRIPGTLRTCTFAIHFENGGRGCVRLAEAFCSQVPEKIVTVPKKSNFVPQANFM